MEKDATCKMRDCKEIFHVAINNSTTGLGGGLGLWFHGDRKNTKLSYNSNSLASKMLQVAHFQESTTDRL